MIVHHAGGLHMSIANGGSEKLKSPLFHILAYSV